MFGKEGRINDKNNPFFGGNYICCSTYGKPRSKDFHWKYFKQLLQENDFNPKAVSKLMGHAKEIITIDVYGDKQEIIEDCLEALEPFIDEVIPEEEEEFDLSVMDYMDSVALELVI